jgi:hypothetical protein
MSALRTYALLLLPAFALLLLGAHFFRAALVPLTAVCLGLIALLFVRDRWAWLALQAGLAIGTLEWLRTAWEFASLRAAMGQPYTRLLVILGSVALVTALAALVLRTRTARDHFRSLS